MDKNFINIDDLVRQRLGGGEEQERAGAWMRMRDLLDKEEAEVKPVGMYWRRMLGAIAVLLLIATITVGGFKMFSTATVSDNSGSNKTVASASPTASTASQHTIDPSDHNSAKENQVDNKNAKTQSSNIKSLSSHSNSVGRTATTTIAVKTPIATKSKSLSNQSEPSNNQNINPDNSAALAVGSVALNNKSKTTSAAFENNDKPGQTDDAQKHTILNSNTTGINNISVAAAKSGEKDPATSSTNSAIATNTTSGTTAPVNSSPAPLATNTKANKTTASSPSSENKKGNSNTKTGKQIANNSSAIASIVNTANNGQPSAGNTAVSSNETNNVEPVLSSEAGNVTNTTSVSDNNNTKEAEKDEKSVTSSSKLSVAHNSKTATTHTRKLVANKNKKTIHAIAKGAKTKKPAGSHVNTSVLAATTGSDENGVSNTSTASQPTNSTAKIGKLALSSHTTTTGDIAGINADDVINNNTTTTGIGTTNHKKAAKHTASVNGTTANTGNVGTGNNLSRGKKDKTAAIAANTKEATAPDTKRVIREYQKMVVYQHYIQTAPNEGYYHLDTISNEKLQEYATTQESTTGSNPSSTRKSGSSNLLSKNAAGASKTLLEASAPSETKAPVKPGTVVEGPADATGKKAIEGLNAAMNDIKYKVGAVQFAPGFIAGINGNFFGPNSFKGFQFGITGNFIFSEQLTLMAELKYFHRVNNDYTFNDDYYSYTQNSSNTWNKSLITNAYSFSTLHSFEMPVSIRYTAANFQFFGGFNIVYAFNINVDAAPQTVTPLQGTFIAPGTDISPKLKVDDFNSRFGVGYLFGISYQVSPNVMVDVRNVQTIWNNASTSGAKYISTELYKSPSLQLSIGYRLGKKKQ